MTMQQTETKTQHLQGEDTSLVAVEREARTALAVRPDNSFALALEPGNLEQAFKVAEIIARTGICNVKDENDVMIRIMTGRSLGLPAMTSIRVIDNIEGTPNIRAAAKQALCQRSPDCELFRVVELTTEQCIIHVKRRGEPQREVKYTIKDAEQAQLLGRGGGKGNWERFRKRMLLARCRSDAADLEFPHVTLNIPTSEDVQGYDDGEVMEGEIVHQVPQVKAAARDFDSEERGFEQAIADAVSGAEMKAVRGRLDAWDGPTASRERLAGVYSKRAEAIRAARNQPAAASPAAPPASPSADPPKTAREPGEEG